jgi:AraC family transcriptional regulator of adaptative response / DNA-3-methyladenine glycosylase II
MGPAPAGFGPGILLAGGGVPRRHKLVSICKLRFDLQTPIRCPNPASGPPRARYNHHVISISSDPTPLDPAACERALGARDARFDGLFFVGITTTRIYCRPVCPARVSYSSHRRFFDSAASAELAGFRPCLRCRPELAPGRAQVDAVPRLARVAAQCIEAGALNGRGVAHLAADLGVSERHLRRALERELGVSPLELAQTHRLLLAKRLLADTTLSVTRIAFASGFQSLRRFNTAFRERYRLSPSAVRRAPRSTTPRTPPTQPGMDLVRLTLAYRPPLAWEELIGCLRREALPGVELVDGERYGRTVWLGGRAGVVFASDAASVESGRSRSRPTHLNVDLSTSLLPVLMPLLARLRQLFDLDAQPSVVDQHLEQGGLGPLVSRRPGLRLPGALDGFEVCLGLLLRGEEGAGWRGDPAGRVIEALGEPIATGIPGLARLAPTPERIAGLGAAGLSALGVPTPRAEAIAAVARSMASGTLRFDPRSDATATHRALTAIDGIDERLATLIVMRALSWPDAFPASDPVLQRAAGASAAPPLLRLAEQWRPWRAYAAHHLWLKDEGEPSLVSASRYSSPGAVPPAAGDKA